MDYSKLSDADLKALYNEDYASMSDEGLKLLYAEEETPTEEKKKGLDLTPSGLIDKAASGIGAVLESPVRMIKDKQSLPEALKSGYVSMENAREAVDARQPVLNNVQDFLTDMAVYGLLPQLKGASILSKVGAFAGNAALQGALPATLESLKAGDSPVKGATTGATIASVLQALPLLGKLSTPAKYIGNSVVKGITHLKPETLEQLVKPNSKALDLTEDTAQNLLMNTTERVQKDYQDLVDAAGEKVNEAVMRLDANRAVPASSLKNTLDDIFNSYSTSGNQALNVAYNKAGNIYKKVNDLIDAGSNVKDIGNVNAENLHDIIKNINSMGIKWDDPSAKTVNTILKQLYGNYTRRLSNLSPELKKANKVFSDLAQFEENEGIRRILKPFKEGDIDAPSSALRNYNSTVTKGNTNRNIQDLEKILVDNGKQPFLNDIDDVNAAMDLINIPQTGMNFAGLTDYARAAVKPALKGIRKLNQSGIPEKTKQVVTKIDEVLEPFKKLTAPALIKASAPILYGGISNVDE